MSDGPRGKVEVEMRESILAGGIEFVIDCGQRAKKKTADVSNDGGTTSGDTVLCEDNEKAGEDLIDVLGGGECGELTDEEGTEVGLRKMDGTGPGVFGAEAGRMVGDDGAAAAARRGTVLATRSVGRLSGRWEINDTAGVGKLVVHVCASQME